MSPHAAETPPMRMHTLLTTILLLTLAVDVSA